MKECCFCGAEVPDNAKFCPKCGNIMGVTQKQNDQDKLNAAVVIKENAAADAPVKATGGTTAKGLGLKIAVIAAAVVVVGAIIAALIIIINSTKPEPPSSEAVMEMAQSMNKWIANSDLGSEPIDLNLDVACELSAILTSECGYTGGEGITRVGNTEHDGYKSTISEDALNQCLHDLFGSEYQASEFHNTKMEDLIQSSYPDYNTNLSGYLIRDENGNLCWYYIGLGEGYADAKVGEVMDVSSAGGNGKTYTATVKYNYYTYSDSDDPGQTINHSTDIVFTLKYDENSKYNWVITSIQEEPFE